MARVLIVDDEPHVIRVLKLALERSGHEVEGASDGEAALERIRRRPPDLLISDIQMPRLSGEELCARLDVEWPERGFPIIVMTSMTFVGEMHWSRRHSNLHMFEKPLSVRRLVAFVEKLLGSRTVADVG